MDLNTSARPPVGRRMKAKAPPPPPAPQPAPRKIFRNAIPDGGGSPGGDTKENMLWNVVELHITLPSGYQTTLAVDGRKALMDLLVDLCSQYHLNPAYHTLELLSPEAQPVAFKPNALLGTLDVSCALIKERVAEERGVRRPPPRVPEKTVRLVVNFHRGQKAVVRVNPLVPLKSLVPVICQKCEFDPAHVLLLRDSVSNHELDLHKSLSELDIRELYVLDQTLESLCSNSLSGSGAEKKGLLGFLRFNRRKSKTEDLSSEDMDDLDDSVMQKTDVYKNGLSVVGGPCVEVRPNTLGQSQSAMNLSRLSPKAEPKKRRAPAPPPPPPQANTTVLASQKRDSPRSDSQMKKRKAPAPPPTPTLSTPEPAITLPAVVVHVPPPAQCRTSVPAQVLRSTVAEDSLSDLSHSIEDSEPAGSICSSSSSDAAAESASSSMADEPMSELLYEIPASSIAEPLPEPEPEPEANPQPTPRRAGKQEPGPSSTPEETESVQVLKMEEMENNRHSAIGSGRNVPLKPKRSPLQELKHSTDSSPTSNLPTPPGQDHQQTLVDIHIHPAPHSWLHSVDGKAEQEAETVSVCSSESLADQGYAASEGMADDSGLLSSPSDLSQPTSPEDTISLNHDPSPTPGHQPKDCSSDSDEGCATWGSRQSGGVRPPERKQNSYEEEAEITAQIHLTLADLDADLAEVNRSDEASVSVEEEVPVSIVDVDVPVTAIDKVLDDDRPGLCVPEAMCTTRTENKQDVMGGSNKLSVEDQKRNNKGSVSKTQTDQCRRSPFSQAIKNKVELEKPSVLSGAVSRRSQSPVVRPAAQRPPTMADSTLRPPPFVRSYSMENPQVEPSTLPSKTPTAAQIKISHSPVSRFGLKTFTVIPHKPAMSLSQKPAGSLGTGAIKIDELGNMVKHREARPSSAQDRYSGPRESAEELDSPLLGKAKAFWSSAEKQDPALGANKGASVKTWEAELPKPVPVKEISCPPEKPTVEECPKEAIGSTNPPESAVINKLPVSDPAENSSVSEQRRNLSFLKPSRRTSSQYVASAIAKYTGKASARVNGIQETAESALDGQSQPANRCFTPEIRPYHNPVAYFSGPKRSQSYPTHVSEKWECSEEPQFTSTASAQSLDPSPVNNKPPQQTRTSTYSESTQSKDNTSRNDSPTKSPSRPTRPPIPKKPEMHSPRVLPEPNQVTLFGPVKKFKPVMMKSVEKETSLHSSLMEAIQSGGGAERLKKVTGSFTTSTKKPSYLESENERTALLSAIRAQSNSARLKKTRSEAAVELEQFKMAEDRAIKSDIPSPTSSDSPAFVPPPPPAFAPPAPPPPPPPPAPPKPALVLPPGGNPESAREAMLEAIRSGAGAERLRKVPAPVKTLTVNGRLGIIQAPAPLPQEH
ncbi:protein cordon-bleu isoform X2 [Hoplias malabaricus]|uniref:protein cordon-bleu isoform X2 n=1 Tax=Hoplias malabaricus TaxID=27720 RepID=UPI0034622CD8